MAIDAIAQGATAAYNKGGDAPGAYAKALGAALGAAAGNGCIDAVFEIVNQAIIKGGYPVEVVVGRALAQASAQGVDSATGEVLAKATAVVICKGGESASACARAWTQAVKMDGNGCPVLIKAYAQAKAQCGPGYATSQTYASVYKEALVACKVAEPSYQPPAPMAPAYNPPSAISVSQGPGGQTINTGSMVIQQGSGGMSISGMPRGGMMRQFGRKMLAVQAGAAGRGSSHRKMLQFGGYFPFSATANAAAINNGWANGPITANSFSQAQGSATSNAVAINNGVANGGVTANANAVAYGR